MAVRPENKTERGWRSAYKKYLEAYEDRIGPESYFAAAGITPYNEYEYRAMFAAVKNTRGYKQHSDAQIAIDVVNAQKQVKMTFGQAKNLQYAYGLRGYSVSIDEIVSGVLPYDVPDIQELISERYRQLSHLTAAEAARIIAREFFGSP